MLLQWPSTSNQGALDIQPIGSNWFQNVSLVTGCGRAGVSFHLHPGRSGRLVRVVVFDKACQEDGHILQGLVSDEIAHVVQSIAH